jgi:SAM-dependent methyltransferase
MGGPHTFGADRAFADRLTALVPDIRYWAWANAAFVARAVRHLTAGGIHQFLDLGCGVAGVHHVLCRDAPHAHVAHVDLDPIAVLHTHDAIHTAGRTDRAAAVHADIRHPALLLKHPEVNRILDFAEPIGIIATGLLHHLDRRDQPETVLSQLRDATVAGTHLVVSHLAPGPRTRDVCTVVTAHEQAAIPLVPRTRRQIGQSLRDWEPVAPGLVWAPRCLPDQAEVMSGRTAHRTCLLATVARARRATGRRERGDAL